MAMKTETLVHHLPTPPNVGVELHSDLHHIAQYNADRSYSFDDSQSYGSPFSSPGPVIHETASHNPSQSFSFSQPAMGLGISQNAYGQASTYYSEAPIPGLPHNAGIYPDSPPTPRSIEDHDDDRRHTRSGRVIAASHSPPGNEASRPKAVPKPRKSKANKGGEKPKTPKLTAALSILTKDMTSIPVRNMKDWVERSAEVRRKEVEKRNGYVTRPMNSFMLYRSAFAERTKQWCLQNNHQVVSSVSGESWPMEPPEVRELYNEYAKIERINHQNAHPTYKFSPSKPSPPSKSSKRKGEFSDDDELSDLDDAEWSPGHGRGSRIRQPRRLDRTVGYPAYNGRGFVEPQYGAHSNGIHRTSWDMTTTAHGRPLPMPMQDDLYNQYFQQSGVHMNMGMPPPNVIDMRRVDTPVAPIHFSPEHSLLGLPGGNAADLLQLNSHDRTPLGDDGQVDPMLLAYDGTPPQELESEYRNDHMGLVEHEDINSLLVSPTQEDFHTTQWQPDPNMAAMEQGSEFEKWVDDHRAG